MKRYRHSELQLFENSFHHCVNDRNRIVRLLIFRKIYAVGVAVVCIRCAGYETVEEYKFTYRCKIRMKSRKSEKTFHEFGQESQEFQL